MKLNFNKNIILENKRVRIEPLDRKHVEPLTPIAIKNPGLLKYSPSKFGTRALLEEYINENLELKNLNEKYPFAIFDKASNAFAGSTSYMNISEKDERLEIGSTWIGKDFQRTGLNRNCKFLLMQYAFETLQFERVEFKTDARNIQSRTAIEGIGGKYEGLLRSHTVLYDGYRRDTVYYSVLLDEWKHVRDTVFGTLKGNKPF